MTEEAIYQGMLELYQQETGYEMKTEADLAVRLRAAAAQIMSLYHYADHVYRQAFPQTAEGENLDRHGALRGCTRGAPSKAAGRLRFGISNPISSTLTIPFGTVCVTENGEAFVTTTFGVLTPGNTYVDVNAVAAEPGAAGNVLANQIVIMQTAPAGFETVTNLAAFTGGEDPEPDESYRKRILARYAGLSNGANIAYYRDLALSVNGVDWVKVIPRADGAGTVTVLIMAETGIITNTLVQEVQDLMEEKREICVDVTVAVPTNVEVDITAEITPSEGYSFAEAKAAVETALEACFIGDRVGKPLYRAELIRAAMDTGIIDNIEISEPAQDVAFDADERPMPGDIELEGA